jgi:hypothetical protein
VPLENSRAIRFPTFEPARHVTLQAKFIWRLPVPVAIDCGLSRHVGGLWFQVRERDAHRRIINLFADERGLLAVARGLDPGDPLRVGPALLDGVARHCAGWPADDDVTVLVLHHNAGPTPRMSVGQKLDVYAKAFGLKAV